MRICKRVALFLVTVILFSIISMVGLVVCGEISDTKLYAYCWEMKNDTFVSVESNDCVKNSLTQESGSVANGNLKGVRYQLQTEVKLYHDIPWAIEWRSTGNWSGMLFASAFQSPSDGLIYLFRDSNTGLFAFGEYIGSWNNYGIKLDCDMTTPHVFRLENRIDSDGSNAVYFLVDGQEIDVMNHYYIIGKDQNKTVEWANGKDITFRNIGTSSHPISGMKLEYFRVWENGHTHSYLATDIVPTCTENGYTSYVCSCGDSYTADYVQAIGHTIENGVCTRCGAKHNPYEGKTIACIGDSITAGVGVTKDKTDYVTQLARAMDMNYVRLGASGSTLCTDGHATCNIGKLTEKNLAGADVVTVLMGINDFVQAQTGYYRLGTIDSTDTSTIYGAMHMWCQQIDKLRQTDSLKNTEFYFLTPLITSWNNSVSSVKNWDQSKTNIHAYTLRDLCNAIIDVCALYDVPVIDLNLISGLYYNSADDNSIEKFGGDGAHPGELGHQMMADALQNTLMKRYMDDDHTHCYESWITTTYPTCEKGEQQRVCSICTATEKRLLPGNGHSYENDEFVCERCGFINYPCGDITGDLKVDILDFVRLKKILVGTAESGGYTADLDTSGVVTAVDLTILSKLLLFIFQIL